MGPPFQGGCVPEVEPGANGAAGEPAAAGADDAACAVDSAGL